MTTPFTTQTSSACPAFIFNASLHIQGIIIADIGFKTFIVRLNLIIYKENVIEY